MEMLIIDETNSCCTKSNCNFCFASSLFCSYIKSQHSSHFEELRFALLGNGFKDNCLNFSAHRKLCSCSSLPGSCDTQYCIKTKFASSVYNSVETEDPRRKWFHCFSFHSLPAPHLRGCEYFCVELSQKRHGRISTNC